MVKKKRREKEEKYTFKPPEFDEREYLRKEIKETKVSVITVLYASFIAFVSLGITMLFKDATLGFLIGLLALVTLKYFYKTVRIDTTTFDWKKWAANISMFFFTWLAVWVLISNPPLSDFAKPTVESIEVNADGKWLSIAEFNRTVPAKFSIRIKITDNDALDIDSLKIRITRGNDMILEKKLVASGTEHYYELKEPVYIPESGIYKITIYASDMHGNECVFAKDISFTAG